MSAYLVLINLVPSDTLKISTMSFTSPDGRSRPWVRKLKGSLFGNQLGMKIDESVEDTVISLS